MRNKIFRTFSFITYLAVAAFSTNVSAALAVIDFGTGLAGPGGIIDDVNNDGSYITGDGIKIGSLSTVNTGNDGTFVTEAVLNFDTNEGTIEVIGGIAILGIADGTTLLSGTFSDWTYLGSGNFFGSGIDTKDPLLLGALGVALNTQFDFFGFSLGFAAENGVLTAISTDIKNTEVVPVPAAVWLFGSGLIGLVGVARRRA